MRVFILTLGTRGDFELFWMLGRELHRRGHRVVIGSSSFYAQPERDPGIEWLTVGHGTRSDMITALQSLAKVKTRRQRGQAFFTRWVEPQFAASKAQSVATGVASDYFISNLKLALNRGVEIVPGAFVTYDPPEKVEDLAFYESRKHGGRILELVAMSRSLVDPDRRWGSEFSFTGFWAPPRWEGGIAPELANFVEGGPAPVVMTMGSMVMFDAKRLAGNFARALRLAGQRGVLVGGWSGVRGAGSAEEGLLVVDEADYEWLFARSSCVVHHGGVGTVASVLRAGAPSILLPQLQCQEDFGRILLRERLATGMFDTHSLNPATLAAAIRRALTDPEVTQSARRWQTIVREDPGVAQAADVIEEHWRRLESGSAAAVREGQTT